MANSDDLHSIANEPSDVVRIERLTHHIARIREGMDEMRKGQDELRASMKQLADALTRLTLVEERHLMMRPPQRSLSFNSHPLEQQDLMIMQSRSGLLT